MSISVEEVLDIFVQFRKHVITIGIGENNNDLLNLCNYYRDSILLNSGIILSDEPLWSNRPSWTIVTPEIVRDKKVNDAHKKSLVDINDCRHGLYKIIRSAQWYTSRNQPFPNTLNKSLIGTTRRLKKMQLDYKHKYDNIQENTQGQISHLVIEQEEEEERKQDEQEELLALPNWLSFIKYRGVTGVLRKTDDRYVELKSEWDRIKCLQRRLLLP